MTSSAREERSPSGGRASTAATATTREARILGIIETTRAKRPRFRDAQITMSHGAGGKATQSLIEGVLAPAFGMEELGDSGAVGLVGNDLRRLPVAFLEVGRVQRVHQVVDDLRCFQDAPH